MRRIGLSLRAKLLLSIGGASVLAMAASGLAFRVSSGAAFQRFIVTQPAGDLSDSVALYYRQHGSLAGFGPPPEDHFVDPNGPPIKFGLTDASGRVVMQGGTSYAAGAPAPPAILTQSRPVVVDGQSVGRILLPSPLPAPNPLAEATYWQFVASSFVWAAAAGLAVAVVAAVMLAEGTARPVRHLTDAARLVAQGKLEHSVPARGADEVAELGRAFNHRCARAAEP